MKSTKKSLVASGLSLLCCMALLAGTTFAWFTDSVVNKGNKIEVGTLDIVLEELNDKGEYQPVGEEPIFNYNLWEPGYSDYAVLRVRNNGTLALKWYLQLVANGAAGELGDVIDVYALVQEGTAITEVPTSLEDAVAKGYKDVGTLNELMADPDGAAHGILYAATNKPVDGYYEAYAGIVLHMQESAGNEYQGASIGTTFDLVLNATQYTYETDGFGSNQYDANAPVIGYTAAADGNDDDEFTAAIAALNEGEILEVSGTVNLTKAVTLDKDVTIRGAEGDSIKSAEDWYGPMINLSADDISVSFSNIKLDNSVVSELTPNVKGSVISFNGVSNAVVTLEDVEMIHFGMSGHLTNGQLNGTDDCESFGVLMNGSANRLIVKDSTIQTETPDTSVNVSWDAGIYASSPNGSVVIDGSTILETKMGVYIGSNASNMTIDVINESTIEAIRVFEVRSKATNNTINVSDSTLFAHQRNQSAAWQSDDYRSGCVLLQGANNTVNIETSTLKSEGVNALDGYGRYYQDYNLPIAFFYTNVGNTVNIDQQSFDTFEYTAGYENNFKGEFIAWDAASAAGNHVYVDGVSQEIVDLEK